MDPFNEEQQAFFDKKIGEKYTEAFTKSEETYNTRLEDALKTAGETHKQAIGKLTLEMEELRKTKSTKSDADNTELLNKLKTLTETVDGLKATGKKDRAKATTGHLEGLAGKLNAYNPEQVATLLKLQTKTDDDGNLVVINASGQPRNNGEGKPMTTEELTKDFLKENPHFVKASGNSGSGSQGAVGGTGGEKTITRKEFFKLSPADQSKTALDKTITITD